MGILIEQEATAVQAAFEFQKNAELVNVRLIACSAEAGTENAGEQPSISIRMKMDTKILARDKEWARFGVTLSATGVREGAPVTADSPGFRIACTHELTYRLHPEYEPKEDQLTAFREGNALFHCWPYARETIHNLAMRMDVYISPLPFLRLVPKSPVPPQTRKSSGAKRRRRQVS